MRLGEIMSLGLAGAMLALASACGGSRPEDLTTVTPSGLRQEHLTGAVWIIVPGDTLLSFHEDGRYRMDPGGAIAYAPDYFGEYEIIGSEVRFAQQADSSDGCPAGTTSIGAVEVEKGSLELHWIDHSCYPEAAGRTWSFIRISPDSVLDPEFPSETPSSTFPAREGNLRGVWFVAGTSILISLDGQGAYQWDDSGLLAWAPQEVGAYSVVEEADEIQLTVAGSTSCEVGDVIRFRDAHIFSTAGLFRIMKAEAQDDCGRLMGPIHLILASS